MGIIADEGQAKNSPCKCFVFGDKDKAEDRLCFSKGIRGALSDEQEGEYCTDILLMETSEDFAKRINKFEVLGNMLDVCLEDEEEDFLRCMENKARELRKNIENGNIVEEKNNPGENKDNPDNEEGIY